jgi:hypothetical protein
MTFPFYRKNPRAKVAPSDANAVIQRLEADNAQLLRENAALMNEILSLQVRLQLTAALLAETNDMLTQSLSDDTSE